MHTRRDYIWLQRCCANMRAATVTCTHSWIRLIAGLSVETEVGEKRWHFHSVDRWEVIWSWWLTQDRLIRLISKNVFGLARWLWEFNAAIIQSSYVFLCALEYLLFFFLKVLMAFSQSVGLLNWTIQARNCRFYRQNVDSYWWVFL